MSDISFPEHVMNNIRRLENRIDELKAIDVEALTEPYPSQLEESAAKISASLESIFGIGTNRFSLFSRAADFHVSYKRYVTETAKKQAFDEYKDRLKHKIDSSVSMLISAIETIEEDYQFKNNPAKRQNSDLSKNIFIVHGHDEEVLQSVARVVEKLGLKPIILREEANMGKHILSKIEEYSGVGFAIVLLTPDDHGAKLGDTLKPRARQNVLLELGYFIGALGIKFVWALKRDEVEIPSDFAGVLWEPWDGPNGAWRMNLARELRAAGYDIDLNRLL